MSTTGRAIAILGAKGGVGTTTVASNLAAELANGGSRSVLLLDLNLFLGDVGLHVGVEREPTVMTWMSAENPGDAKRNIRNTPWPCPYRARPSDADAVEAHECCASQLGCPRSTWSSSTAGQTSTKSPHRLCYADDRLLVNRAATLLIGAKRRLDVLKSSRLRYSRGHHQSRPPR